MESVLSKVQSFSEFNETVELENDLKKFVYGHSIVAIVPVNSKYLQLILDNLEPCNLLDLRFQDIQH